MRDCRLIKRNNRRLESTFLHTSNLQVIYNFMEGKRRADPKILVAGIDYLTLYNYTRQIAN